MSTEPTYPPVYPVFLKLEGRRCVVFGGGPIAAQKSREMLEAGAEVVLISPELGERCTELIKKHAAQVTYLKRPYAPGDCAGAFIVLSATADPDVDARIEQEAREAGALVNIVDVPPQCDFYAGSVVRRGPVTVLIGSSGTSPSVAIAIKNRIKAVLPEKIGTLAARLGAARPRLLARFPNYRDRADRLNRIVRETYRAVDGHDAGDFDRWIETALACDRDCGSVETCCIQRDHL